MTLIGFVVVIVILGLIFYLVQQLPIAAPFKNAVIVVFILILIVLLLRLLVGTEFLNIRI